MSTRQAMQDRRNLFLEQVAHERRFQLGKWGRDSHSPEFWMLLIQKHMGELSELCLKVETNEYCIDEEYAMTIVQGMCTKRIVIAALITAWEEQVWTRHLGDDNVQRKDPS